MSGVGVIPLDQSGIPRRFHIPPTLPKPVMKSFSPMTIRRGKGGKKRKTRGRKARKTRRHPRRK